MAGLENSAADVDCSGADLEGSFAESPSARLPKVLEFYKDVLELEKEAE